MAWITSVCFELPMGPYSVYLAYHYVSKIHIVYRSSPFIFIYVWFLYKNMPKMEQFPVWGYPGAINILVRFFDEHMGLYSRVGLQVIRQVCV